MAQLTLEQYLEKTQTKRYCLVLYDAHVATGIPLKVLSSDDSSEIKKMHAEFARKYYAKDTERYRLSFWKKQADGRYVRVIKRDLD